MSISFVTEHRRIKVFIDGELWRVFAPGPFKPLLCEIGDMQSREELEALFHKVEPKLALKKAVELLAKRPLPSSQLKKKLIERGFLAEVAQKVVSRCQTEGWISDREWIESYIRLRQGKGYGKKRIEMELKQKGMQWPGDLKSEESKLLKVLIEKRYSNIKERKERQKAITSLCRRGFDLEAVLYHLSQLESTA